MSSFVWLDKSRDLLPHLVVKIGITQLQPSLVQLMLTSLQQSFGLKVMVIVHILLMVWVKI